MSHAPKMDTNTTDRSENPAAPSVGSGALFAEGPHYGVTGYDTAGNACARIAIFAASAGLAAVEADAVTMLHDYGHPEVVRAKAATLLCPTCKSGRWAECHSSKQDATGFTLYCRRCEDGCVSPLLANDPS